MHAPVRPAPGRSAIPLNRENSLQAALGNNLRRIVLNVLFAMQRRHAVCEVFIRTRYGEDKAFQELSGTFSALGDGGSGLFGRPDPTCERTGALQQSHSIVCSRPIDRKEGKSSTVHLETTIIPLCGPKMLPGVPGPEPRRPENRRNCCRTARNPPDDFIRKIPDAIFAVDRKGKVISWNRAIEDDRHQSRGYTRALLPIDPEKPA